MIITYVFIPAGNSSGSKGAVFTIVFDIHENYDYTYRLSGSSLSELLQKYSSTNEANSLWSLGVKPTERCLFMLLTILAATVHQQLCSYGNTDTSVYYPLLILR